MLSLNDLQRAAYESTLDRNLGGKSVFADVVSGVGSSTVITPGAGKAVELYWVYAVTDPDSDNSPLITIKLGNKSLYATYAIAHWEVFRGAVGESVTVTLSQAASVAVTIHYKEF